jgi:hypothetical protein
MSKIKSALRNYREGSLLPLLQKFLGPDLEQPDLGGIYGSSVGALATIELYESSERIKLLTYGLMFLTAVLCFLTVVLILKTPR